MAPFTHVSPDRPSRFTRGAYGVLYVAERFETALLETMRHHSRFMARTAEPAGWTSQFRELVLDVAADLHDLRGGDPAWAPALRPDDYEEAQTLAATLRANASEGIVYPSRRDPGGDCVGLFYPDRASNLVQGRHLDYHWDGHTVDLYRDAGSGSVFRVGR
jgi:RES domain-containing protein